MHGVQRVSFSLLIPLLLVFAPISAHVAAQATTNAPRFDVAPCMFTLPDGHTEGKTVVCGYLTVPEVHANPAGPRIRLAIAILKATAAKTQPDPVVFLRGGPGGEIQPEIDTFFDRETADADLPFPRDRDFIAFEQRGVGQSQPALNCPEVSSQRLSMANDNVSPETKTDRIIAATLQCRDRLVGLGINLSAYTSTESAADLNDLRTALGVPQINLVGVSYGTRLALAAMRDYPQIVRSAVLDSVFPPEVNAFEDDGANFNRILTQTFAACAAAKSCAKQFPNLASDFSDVFARLNAQPIAHETIDRTTGKSYPSVYNGYSLVDTITSDFYDEEGVLDVISMIEDLKQDNIPQRLDSSKADVNILQRGGGLAMYYSVTCSEETPFNNRDLSFGNVEKILPELRPRFNALLKVTYAVCDKWPTKPAGAFHQRVTSTIPALLLSSSNDPATPLLYAQSAAMGLPNGILLRFPGVGHGVIYESSGCGASVSRAFLSNPTRRPPTDCIAKI